MTKTILTVFFLKHGVEYRPIRPILYKCNASASVTRHNEL